MGAPIRAFTRLSKNPIYVHSQINEPNVVIVLDPTVMGAVDVSEGLQDDGVLIINSEEDPEQIREKLNFDRGRVFTVDADSIALKHLDKKITNTSMLGALAAATGIFSSDQLAEQIQHKFERKFGEEIVHANILALREAAEKIQEG